jgi:hypothetical protein
VRPEDIARSRGEWSAVTLQPGTRLGPYEIISPLGAGGMGEVYPGHGWEMAPDGRVLISTGQTEAETRAWEEKTLSDRIRIDLGGLGALVSGAGKQPPGREK